MGQRARVAASSYLASISDEDDDLSVTIHLARAWTIARKYKVADVEDEVLDEILSRVDSISPGHPGSLLPLVAILCRKPTNTARADALRADAERILTGLAQVLTRSHLATEVAELRLSLVQQGAEAEAERVQIRRDQLTALRLATTSRDMHPAVRQHHLATAAEFATRHNFKPELKQIRAELEAIPVEALGLIRFSHSASIPRHMPEIEMHPFTRGHLWQDALGYFLHTGPPTGDVDRLRADASTDRGLLSIFPTQLLGHGGLPRVTLTTEDEEITHRMTQHSKVVAETVGRCHAEGLRRLADRYGVPTQEGLRAYFIERYNCDPGGAHILATAYRQFWNGEFVEAVHLLSPRPKRPLGGSCANSTRHLQGRRREQRRRVPQPPGAPGRARRAGARPVLVLVPELDLPRTSGAEPTQRRRSRIRGWHRSHLHRARPAGRVAPDHNQRHDREREPDHLRSGPSGAASRDPSRR